MFRDSRGEPEKLEALHRSGWVDWFGATSCFAGFVFLLGASQPIQAASGGIERTPSVAVDAAQEPGRSGLLFNGTHRIVAVVPMNAPVVDYQNVGYALREMPASKATKDPRGTENRQVGRKIEIFVRLDSARSKAPFPPEAKTLRSEFLGTSVDPEIVRLAGNLAHGFHTLESVVTAVLSWTARNIEYRLDRAEAQDARSVLRRRSGYCTGSAALAVALLNAAGIEAREVVGYSLATLGDRPPGYHRWIEVHYPDLGWRFSDPNASLGFVSANYVRLAERRVPVVGAGSWEVLSEVDHRRPVTSLGTLPRGIDGRYQGEAVWGASLRVDLGTTRHEGKIPNVPRLEVELTGPRWILRRPVHHGLADFVNLAPGRYRVNALLAGNKVQAERSIVVSGTGDFELVMGGGNR